MPRAPGDPSLAFVEVDVVTGEGGVVVDGEHVGDAPGAGDGFECCRGGGLRGVCLVGVELSTATARVDGMTLCRR